VRFAVMAIWGVEGRAPDAQIGAFIHSEEKGLAKAVRIREKLIK